MTPRIICPHCHSPIDPLTLEDAVSAGTRYVICPECDDPIAVPADSASAIPPAGEFSATLQKSPPANVCPVESRAL
jgi:uncharacterized protein YlaI